MKHRQRPRSKRFLILLGAGICLALFLLYSGGKWLEARNAKPELRGDPHQRYASEIIEVDGKSYRKRPNLTTMLLMGVDRDSNARVTGYRNGGQADFLRLVVIDNAAQTVSQLQIDRDTMTPITILGVLGDRSGVRTTQICLSHGFGDGRAQSCEFTVEAVSNLLLETPIDCYMAMNLDGISVLNDWVGGVTVTLEDDFSALDPSMTPGTTLTLQGEQAETFVRTRRSIGVGTNEARMKRQQLYISQLTTLMNERFHQSEEAVGELYDALESYLITDMSRGRLINEVWLAKDYERMPLVELPGTYGVGADGFMQFEVDETALQQTVLKLFYSEVK